jgi:DNA-binding GntR family transcriptional regulator
MTAHADINRSGERRPQPVLDLPAGLRLSGTSAPDQIVGVLRQMIFEGRIAPGTPLREAALASTFDVSRNTLREAIRSLVHEGLARHERNRGAVVVSLGDSDARDLYAARQVLEPTAVAALDAASQESIDAVQRAFDGLERALSGGAWSAIIDADIAFHRSIVGLHGSERLVRCFAVIESELAYFLSLIRLGEHEHERPQDLLDEHATILHAVLARDSDEARARVIAHLTYYEQRARSLPEARAPQRG